MNVSATECAASDSIAPEPVMMPATSFMTAIARFTPPASRTVSVLSPPEFPFSSVTLVSVIVRGGEGRAVRVP